MIKFCFGINDDIEEMESCLLLLQNTINIKKEQEAKKQLERDELRKKIKAKRPKKTVQQLLDEINDELQDWTGEKDEAETHIEELTIKKDELEKRLEPELVNAPVPKKKAPKRVSLEKKEKSDFDGTIKFLIDETIKRSQMDKEMFSV
jgi:hypothetical protein